MGYSSVWIWNGKLIGYFGIPGIYLALGNAKEKRLFFCISFFIS